MKYILQITLFIFLSIVHAEDYEDYIVEIQANIKIIKEYTISKTEKFRSYELIGTFTDEYGNYGKFDAIITSDIKKGKLIKLEATAKNIYMNEEFIFMKAYRKESDYDAGIAISEIVGASENFKPLIGVKCVQSVRYFKDTIFGLQKCKISKEQSKILKR